MRNDRLDEFEEKLVYLVGKNNVLTKDRQTHFYKTGIRVGGGHACAIILPNTLLELWHVLEVCISFDKIIILQAANTGLTGGSTPDGRMYDRDVVIINTLKLNKVKVLKNGEQVLAFPGTTLYQLEKELLQFSRGPHSVIGSSCIGASVVGGVCNNSGGNLVNRGPAYTELSLFARINNQGKLELINHLDIDLGSTPEEILLNIDSINFDNRNINQSPKLASDVEYKKRVRNIKSGIPARFNADKRRLFEASGCAGKIVVFAVRLDTFPAPKHERVFFLGSNDPKHFTKLRKKILGEFKTLPDMGEYMHKSYFDGAYKYCKDNFLLIKYLGTEFIPKLFSIKRKIDYYLAKLPFLPNNFLDRILQFIAALMPHHLPKKLRDFSDKFEHYMIILSSDDCIDETRIALQNEISEIKNYEYIECESQEGNDLLLHRYVAGSAPGRYCALNPEQSGSLLPLDVALPRNCDSWDQILPEEIMSKIDKAFKMSHFMCMVFHWDFVVKKEVDIVNLKEKIFHILKKSGAKYPAEHNVGHLYKAEENLVQFYKKLDPTNTFNAGIGKTSKNIFYK